MKTTVDRPPKKVAGPSGGDFDDYARAVEVGLDADGRSRLEALRAHYSLASQLITLRKRSKLTQMEVADRAHVNQSDVSRLERGSANVSQASLERIALVFGARLGFVGPDDRPLS